MVWRHACAALIVLLIGGCGASRPDPGAKEHLACGLERFSVADVFGGLQAYQRVQTGVGAPPAEFNVLALSAGGEFGVFGAGFVRGWREAGLAAWPVSSQNIQIVTAVSAGALLATHVFIGEESFLHEVLPKIGREQLFKGRRLSLLWANAFLDDEGKNRNQREIVLPERVIDAVAKVPPGRFLYVGVTDMDSGRFLQVDMARLARELQPRELRDNCYRAVIGASTAIPVLMAPKFVDSMMLSDGAVRHHLFNPVAPPESMDRSLRRRILAVIHGDLLPAEPLRCADAPGRICNGLVPIALRTAALSADQGMQDSLRAVEQLARQPVAESSEPMFDTFYVTARRAIAGCARVRATACTGGADARDAGYCVAYMRCLADQGRAEGLATAGNVSPWQSFGALVGVPSPAQGPK